MRSRALLGLALAGLLLAAPLTRADDKPAEKTPEPPGTFKPAILLRLQGLDDLVANLRYLFKQAGQKEIGDQIETGLRMLTGPKGLAGVDTKKPIALYASVASKITESQVVLMLPISDEKKFLAFLEERDLKAQKDSDDLYTLTADNLPRPVLFRFGNGYLYATGKLTKNSRLPGKDKLPKPATVLAGGGGLLSLTANIDRIPNDIRKLVVSAVALRLGDLKDEKLPNETDAQQALRGAMLDEIAAQFKSVIEDGGPAQIKLDVDRKTHDLSLSLSLAGKPDTALAKNLVALARRKGIGVGLVGSDSALGGFMNLALPEPVIKKLGPAMDDNFKQLLGKLGKQERDLLAPLVKAWEDTARSGRLDMGLDLRGPLKSGKYTVVACTEVKEGEKIEAAIRKLLDKLPEEVRKVVKLDIGKVNGVSIHRVDQKDVDANTRAILGEGPLFFAVRKDAAVVAMGEGALDALKSAVAAEPKRGNLVQVEASLARMAKLFEQTHLKGAQEAAKEAFKEKGSDKVSLVVKSGASLQVKFSVKSAVLTFAGLLDKARQGPKDD